MQKITYQVVQQILELTSFSSQAISSITHWNCQNKRKTEKRENMKIEKWEVNEKQKKKHKNGRYE